MRMGTSLLDTEEPIRADIQNPFSHSIKLSIYDKIRVGFLSVFVFIPRLILMFTCIFLAWGLSVVGIYGLTEESLREKPLGGWRRWMKRLELLICRIGFWAIGFQYIKVTGQRVDRTVAPIVVAAPHSSFFDTLLEFTVALHCPVVREQNRETPLLSTLINFTQPLYVQREDPLSRKETIQEIKRRSYSSDPWETLLIFPEGTCSNHTCLIPFKLGAFYPGVPIQPVVIKYPNTLDSLTWTWNGPGAMRQLWLTMTQFHVFCEIEYLPVYVPNQEEKADPRLFAENVRKLMAKKVNLPLSYFSFDDIQHIFYASKLQLPQTAPVIKFLKLQNKKGLDVVSVIKEIQRVGQIIDASPKRVLTRSQLTELLQLPPTEALRDLFETLDQEKVGEIDLKSFLCGLWLINLTPSMSVRVDNMFKTLSSNQEAPELDEEGFKTVVWILLGFTSDIASRLFSELKQADTNLVSLANFKQSLSCSKNYFDFFQEDTTKIEEGLLLLHQVPHRNGFVKNEE